ncbi:MAG TPA: OmpA family protein [Dongiaceae bacterium]|nr:OmpA family protein [Dongiaceae bacterium]
MSKQTWIIAGALTMTLLMVGLGFSFYAKHRELEQANAELAQARVTLAQSQAEASELGRKLTENQAQIGNLEKEKETALQSQRNLESEMRTALESKDVTISQLQGKLTVNILDRILFDSGEADLKPDGAEVLRKVATILAAHPTLRIHVIGHTDDVPIRAAARKRFPSNWELSTARATSAVRFLTEQAGVDPRRLGAVGYGEFRPVASNSTPEGRARNRRIAITILSDELVGADTVPTTAGGIPLPPPRAAGPTNVPAASQTAAGATNDAAAPPTAAGATTNVPPDASATPTNAPVTK